MKKSVWLISFIAVFILLSMTLISCDSAEAEVEEPVQKTLLFMDKEATGSTTVYHRVGFRHPESMTEEDKAATVLPNAVMLKAGSSLSDLPVPERAGYTFEGWYYDSAMTEPVLEGDTLTENTVLYPHMIPGGVSAFVLE